MHFNVDINSLELIQDPNPFGSTPTAINLKRGDSVPVEVTFFRDGIADLLPSSTVLSFGAKPLGEHDTDPVILLSEFSLTSDATAAATLTAGAVSATTITAGGTGYSSAPAVTVSAPAAAVTATATAAISAGAVSAATVTNGGHYYANAPTVTVSAPDTATTATATSALTSGVVSAVAVTNGGGFYNAAPPVTFAAPPAFVTATASATIGASATVEWIAPVKGGGYYATAPAVTIAAPATPQRAMGFVFIRPSGIGGDYCVDLGAILGGGSGYSTVPTVTITPDITDPTGADATAEAVIANGKVTALIITNPGNGLYTTVPYVTIDLPTVSTATATATISNGIVNGYTITDPGGGYMTAPAVIVAAPPNPAAATGTATLTGGIVTGVTVTSGGSGYITPPEITIAAPAGTTSQAAATAAVSGGVVSAITITAAGSGYITPPTVTVAAPPEKRTATLTARISNGSVSALGIDDAGFGYTAAPTVTIEAAPLKYIGTANLNTTALNALFLIDGNTANDPAAIDLTAEFTWQLPAGLPTSTKSFLLSVENDVVRDGEAAPVPTPTADVWLESQRPATIISQSAPVDGSLQRESLTVTGTATTSGLYKVSMTGSDLGTASPVEMMVQFETGQNSTACATAIEEVLLSNSWITDAYLIDRAANVVYFNRKVDAELDATLNMSLANEDGGGINNVASSALESHVAGTPGKLGQFIIVAADGIYMCIAETPEYRWKAIASI